jgi:hypothetical protein
VVAPVAVSVLGPAKATSLARSRSEGGDLERERRRELSPPNPERVAPPASLDGAAYNFPVVGPFAAGGVAQRGRSRPGELRFARRLLGLVGALLLAGGVVGAILAAPSGASATATAEGAAENVAVAAASRLSAWTSEVSNELDTFAAAIVSEPGDTLPELAGSFQTLLTGTSDFRLIELTDLSGQVIAASNGGGPNLVGASWLSELSATPLLTPISRDGTTLQWFVARLATTGRYSGALVAQIQTSQMANVLSGADIGSAAAGELQAVLPGGVLLFSSSMTTTLHAGLTDAAMITDGSLSQRVSSPAVTAALAGDTGGTSYDAKGIDTVAGYTTVQLPGWVMGIVTTERANGVLAATPGLLSSPWLLPTVAALAGMALFWLLALTAPTGSLDVLTGWLRSAGPWLALLPRRRLRPATQPLSGGTWETPDLPQAPTGEETTVGHRGPASTGRHRPTRRRLRGRYEILDVTGSGGEGQVLRALDQLHSRQVAIKVRRLDAGDLARRDEILNEASVLLRMTPHPHASVVREDFIIGDRYYLVMDWIEGTPLNRLLAERGTPGLPLGTVLGWMGQVAEVLDHLHSQTPMIVHGDVKPSNVIVTSIWDASAILVDFGVARRRENPTDSIASLDARGVVGSPGYMAPEMQAGSSATPAADIFGLAATTFALLVGHTPVVGQPPNWETIDPRAAPLLKAAFKTGLAFDPSRRPHSAGSFIASLRLAAWPPDPPRRAATAKR